MGIVGLCSDHAGFELKEYIKTILEERGLSYKDFGTYSSDSCDYPGFAHLMGKARRSWRGLSGNSCLRYREWH